MKSNVRRKKQAQTTETLQPIGLDELELGEERENIEKLVEMNWQSPHHFVKEAVEIFFNGVLDGTNECLENLLDEGILRNAWFQTSTILTKAPTKRELKQALSYLDLFAPKVPEFIERLGLDETKSKVLSRIASEEKLKPRRLISEAVCYLGSTAMDECGGWFERCSETSNHRRFRHKDPHRYHVMNEPLPT